MSQGPFASITRSKTLGEQGTASSLSFSRLESTRPALIGRSKARTLQNGTIPENVVQEANPSSHSEKENTQPGDVFEKVSNDATLTRGVGGSGSPVLVPDGFDELPQDVVSVTERFIEKLTAKVYSTPPSVDTLSDLFQEFYMTAGAHISTHIRALSSRQYRDGLQAPSIQIKGSQTVRDAKRLRPMPSKDTLDKAAPEQQMLTPQEISERRKTRRLLEQKGIALEEAVERRVCERVYDRIWRHRSTLDEVRDEKLRSRTAALALVGIGLEDLGIKFDESSTKSKEVIDAEIEKWIAKAREGLFRMDDAKYPLGKLQHLAAAHKSIVDLLTSLHQSSSSADEILPTLIYTLITSPPEGINVISNLQFTQRFRAASKIDGEMAYCLTNLEAAISFLETVDLASLRSDESLEGPPKSSSRPSTPRDDSHDPWSFPESFGETAGGTTAVVTATVARPKSLTVSHPLEESLQHTNIAQAVYPAHSGRLSQIFQPPADALGAASDAVRNSADQGLKNIGNTLDNSFNFLFGRLREQHINGSESDTQRGVILPLTLEDARKLVDPKSTTDEEGDTSRASSIAEQAGTVVESPMRLDDRILGIFAGQRDRSADSAQSSGSGRRVSLAAESAKAKEKTPSPSHSSTTGSVPSFSPTIQHDHTHAAIESMRSLGNTLNPLNRFASMNVMRGFSRNSPVAAASPVVSTLPATLDNSMLETPTSTGKEKTHLLSESPGRISPPIPRFMTVADANDLRIGEVEELLKDYKRLASALLESRAF